GWTNSVPIFHDNVTYIFQDKIPDFTQPYIDNVLVRGPPMCHELLDGLYETVPENLHIKRFVSDHFVDCNRSLTCLAYAGGTVSRKKLQICCDTSRVVVLLQRHEAG
ncbi:hypothetical protein K438DRAFT_1593362, partial [Mycena galopus ATCC 62051]